MCGIAGFSRAEGSRVNARALAHNLLAQIEKRGDHASGYAWIAPDGTRGVYKQPKPGGQLPLAELPRDAQTVILHTRFATQGSTKDNRNNHPVMSTDNNVALVHNGVISNDAVLRHDLGITAEHGQVDSLVIPSLIAQHGVSALSKLRGYAAIAWIDNEDMSLRIARLKNSPVSYTWTSDGTFVFASTDTLLKGGLIGANIEFGGVFDMIDGTMMTVDYGFVSENEKAPSMAYDSYSYGRYSNATSGGHGASGSNSTKGSEDSKTGSITKLYPSNWQDEDASDEEELVDIEAYFEDLEKWRAERDAKDAAAASPPEVIFDSGRFREVENDTPSDEELLAILEARDDEERTAIGSRYMQGEGFYIIDGDGDINHYPSLEDLESALRWLARMSRNEFDLWPTAEDDIYWINFIMDIGSVDDQGTIISWVDDSSDIDYYESPAVRHLQYIRDGVHKLEATKGV